MAMIKVKELFQKYTKRRSVKYGLPLVLFCVCGSFGLREFTDVRYRYRKHKSFREEVSTEGFELTDPKTLTLEAQYEKLKEVDIDNWENVRIPRPYEE